MNHSSSFGGYEATRVLVPGLYFATLLLFLFWSGLAPHLSSAALDGFPLILLFVVVTIVSGLTLYAKETTKRRKAFLDNQPSLYLKNKARAMPALPALEDGDARRLYFFILNNHVPATFHEKIFVFGTIYHIMTQIRRTSFWFAVSSTGFTLYQLSTGRTLPELQALVFFTVAVWLVYLLNVRYNKADRKMQENYQDQIFWLEVNKETVDRLITQRTQK